LQWYYPDYPYTRQYPNAAGLLAPGGYTPTAYPISPEGVAVWQDSVAAYSSQISSFWTSEGEMRADIIRHLEAFGGISIWQPELDK
jgi:hypothetical protein